MQFVDFITYQNDNIMNLIDLINEKIDILKPKLAKQTSSLYNKISKETVVDQFIRKSFKFNVLDDELFAYIKIILSNIFLKVESKVESIASEYKYQIIFDELELLVYEPGGFFLPHTDFQKLKSNMFQSYTMLIGLNSDVVGGETVLSNNKNELKVFKEPITKGGVLIFRNDIEHSSNVVMSGVKNVLKVDLLLYHKIKDTEFDGLLIITNDNHANILCYDLFKNQKESIIYFAYHDKKKLLKLADVSYKEYEIILKILSSNENICHNETNTKIMKKLGLKYIEGNDNNKKCVNINKNVINVDSSIEFMNNFLQNNDEYVILPQHMMRYYKHLCDFNINKLIPIQLIYYDVTTDDFAGRYEHNKLCHFSIYNGLPMYSILCAGYDTGDHAWIWTELNFNECEYNKNMEVKLAKYNPLFEYEIANINDYRTARNECYKVENEDQFQDIEGNISIDHLENFYGYNRYKFIGIEGKTPIDYLENVANIIKDVIINDLRESTLKIKNVDENNYPNEFDKNIIINGYKYIKKKFIDADYLKKYFSLPTNEDDIKRMEDQDEYWCNSNGYYTLKLDSYVGFIKIQ